MPMSPYIANLRARVGHDLLMSPGVAAIIRSDHREILLQRRSDNGRWGLPGGAIAGAALPIGPPLYEAPEIAGKIR